MECEGVDVTTRGQISFEEFGSFLGRRRMVFLFMMSVDLKESWIEDTILILVHRVN